MKTVTNFWFGNTEILDDCVQAIAGAVAKGHLLDVPFETTTDYLGAKWHVLCRPSPETGERSWTIRVTQLPVRGLE